MKLYTERRGRRERWKDIEGENGGGHREEREERENRRREEGGGDRQVRNWCVREGTRGMVIHKSAQSL